MYITRYILCTSTDIEVLDCVWKLWKQADPWASEIIPHYIPLIYLHIQIVPNEYRIKKKMLRVVYRQFG